MSKGNPDNGFIKVWYSSPKETDELVEIDNVGFGKPITYYSQKYRQLAEASRAPEPNTIAIVIDDERFTLWYVSSNTNRLDCYGPKAVYRSQSSERTVEVDDQSTIHRGTGWEK